MPSTGSDRSGSFNYQIKLGLTMPSTGSDRSGSFNYQLPNKVEGQVNYL